MKKNVFMLIEALIVIAFVITGCSKDNTDDLKNKYGFQPPIDKLYWGMSLEEIEDSLSIQDGVDNVVYNYDKPITTIILPQKIEKFGSEATVYLQVCDAPNVDWSPYKSSYLIDVKLIYTDIDMQKLKENMEKVFDDTGEDKVSLVYKECTTWQSKDKISDLDPQLLNKLQKYWKLLDEHVVEETQYSMVKSEDERINTVILTYGESYSAMIIYDGDTAIPINKVCLDSSVQ